MPASTGRRQARTFASPPICTRQLGQWPAQQSRPRGRWYLKERLSVFTPAAASAEPMVSPGWALALHPVEGELDQPGAVDHLAGAGLLPGAGASLRAAGGQPSSPSEGRHSQAADHLVAAAVAFDRGTTGRTRTRAATNRSADPSGWRAGRGSGSTPHPGFPPAWSASGGSRRRSGTRWRFARRSWGRVSAASRQWPTEAAPFSPTWSNSAKRDSRNGAISSGVRFVAISSAMVLPQIGEALKP